MKRKYGCFVLLFFGLWFVLSFVLWVLLCTFCPGIAAMDPAYGRFDPDPSYRGALVDRSWDEVAVLDLYDSYYDTLFDGDKAVYDAIYSMVRDYASSGASDLRDVPFSVADGDYILRVAHFVLYDHPEYASLWRSDLLTQGDHRIGIDTCGHADDMVPDSWYETVAADIPDDLTVEQKALSCFRYLVDYASYDKDVGDHAHDDSGIVLERKACCQGASFAFSRLLTACGVRNTVLTCYISTGEYHMVSAVYFPSVSGWVIVDTASALGEDEPSALHWFAMDFSDVRSMLDTVDYLSVGGNLFWNEPRSVRDVLRKAPMEPVSLSVAKPVDK